MKRLAAWVVLLAIIPGTPSAHRPGNDTDAVIAAGLFPLGPQNPPLRVLSETVRVTLDRGGVTATRAYVIRNDGAAGTIQLATICGVPNMLDADCGEVLVNGAKPALRRSVGYLVDDGDHVSIRQLARPEIEQCLKHLDGNVCGHGWVSFSTDLRAGDTLQVSVRYQSPFSERYWIQSVVEEVYLYSEKFWSGDSIPHVALWVQVRGGALDIQAWTPRGPDAQYSSAPTGAVAGAITWRRDGYRPIKKSYTYKVRLLHPAAVDADQIRRVYNEAMARQR